MEHLKVFGSRAGSTAKAPRMMGVAAVMVAGALGASSQAWAITDKEEAAMGQKMNEAMAGSMGGVLPPSNPMAQRVDRIGRRFAHLARPRSFGYRYRVLQNSTVLNAFAAPGGTIYITSRLVKFTRSDDELASILGHETAHVSQRHISQEVDDRNAFIHFSARLAQMRREAAQGARTGAPKKKAAPKKSDEEIQAESMASASPATILTWFFLSRGRSRALESEADAVSVRWMRRLGYNPRASITLLQHAASTMPRSSSPISSLLASHPGTPERVLALRELIEREKLDLPAKPGARPATSARPASAPAASKSPVATSNPSPTTATSDVAAAAAAGTSLPTKPSTPPTP